MKKMGDKDNKNLNQTVFIQTTCTKQNVQDIEHMASDIYNKLCSKISSRKKREDILTGKRELKSEDLNPKRKPETVTKEDVVLPILKSLGYTDDDINSETAEPVAGSVNWADYKLAIDEESVMVEVEPLGAELDVPKRGINQVKQIIMSKSVATNYGVATNGFKWVLLKYDLATRKIEEVDSVSLLPVFAAKMGYGTFPVGENQQVIITNLYKIFAKENIITVLNQGPIALERKKEEISKNFYAKYMELVFGVGTGEKEHHISLISTIKAPEEAATEQKNLFAITFMNRLLFIKFLEDKRLVKQDFLRNLWKGYKSKITAPVSFYKGYLEPLFFKVFNTPADQRAEEVNKVTDFKYIPYLNGGLFKRGPSETSYDIEDGIIGNIINDLLFNYSFSISGRGAKLDPAVLGNVFEKTVNFLAEPGENQQKAKGAYYTPDDTTSYITREVLHPFLLHNIVTKLRNSGWNETELGQYNTLENFLSNLPRTTNDVKAALEIVQGVTVLDPACGSGHFLSTALNELLYINERLLVALNQEYDAFDLKRKIISNNLYGVDVEGPAVEIARLRLWLSLIEDLGPKNTSNVKTLPNIEFNILDGDSLNGLLDENIRQITLPSLNVEEQINQLEKIFEENGMELDIINDLRRNAQQGANTGKILEVYSALRRIYPSAPYKAGGTISNILNNIRSELNHQVTEDLISSKIHSILHHSGPHKNAEMWDKLAGALVRSFNWKVNFYDIINRGGFDLVIGNPPWVESAKNKIELFGDYKTGDCGNTYAFFVERALRLVRPGGYVGFILPVSAVSTTRMASLQKLLINSVSELRISNYDDRPGKIFQGLEHSRSSIILAKKKLNDTEKSQIYTTTYNRWKSEDRSKLFTNLEYTMANDFIIPGSIPKIGKPIEGEILKKLDLKQPLKKLRKEGGPIVSIWFHNAPQYWIRAQDFVPYFSSEKKGEKISSHLHEIKVQKKYAKALIAILNSSLFYWYFVIYSDGRDLTNREISNFPMSLAEMDNDIRNAISEAADELMKDYLHNSQRKKTNNKRTGKVEYDEFYPGLSKGIIDKIDDLLAKHYGLTDDELNFIKNYSIEFRLSEVNINEQKPGIITYL